MAFLHSIANSANPVTSARTQCEGLMFASGRWVALVTSDTSWTGKVNVRCGMTRNSMFLALSNCFHLVLRVLHFDESHLTLHLIPQLALFLIRAGFRNGSPLIIRIK
ncbi:hypothetical protein AYO22_01953 [Fonsecaea multimorphosa]|nr:hypothetical protein AYO22_01953 [Fonsecaea multimorphosa]